MQKCLVLFLTNRVQSSTQNPSVPFNSSKKVAGIKALAEEEVSKMKEEIKLARDAEVHSPDGLQSCRDVGERGLYTLATFFISLLLLGNVCAQLFYVAGGVTTTKD